MVRFVKLNLVLAWMTLIFITSSITFPNSDSTAQKNLYDYVFDKDVHIILFGILAFLSASFFSTYHLKFRKVFFLVVFTAALYGFIDECHQIFVIGREASAYDLAFDVIGAIFGIGIYRILTTARTRVQSAKKYAKEQHVRLN